MQLSALLVLLLALAVVDPAAARPMSISSAVHSMRQTHNHASESTKHAANKASAVSVSAAASADSSKSLNGLELCLAGAFATVFGDFIMHPVDTIKVFQQASAANIGIIQAVRAIWRSGTKYSFAEGPPAAHPSPLH